MVSGVGDFLTRLSTNDRYDPQARQMAARITRAMTGAMELPNDTPPVPRKPVVPDTRCTSRNLTHSDSDTDSEDDEPHRQPDRRVSFENDVGQFPTNNRSNARNNPYPAPAPAQASSVASGSASSLSAADLLQLLARFDNRPVPKPDRYTWQGGRNLEQFLMQFQQYCEGTFRGDSSLWVGELSALLTGDVKEVLDSVWTYGMSFLEVKNELLRWASIQTKHSVLKTAIVK